MQAKNALYAAVGAPVVAARKVTDAVGDLRNKISKETSDYAKVAEKTMETWASEGEKVVARISDNKAIEEITNKVDLDQAKEQVGKLRTQLEDMLATWRASFRPEDGRQKGADKVEVTEAPKKPAAKKPAAKKPAAKATAKTSAAKTTGSTAAKKSSAKSTTAKSAKAS